MAYKRQKAEDIEKLFDRTMVMDNPKCIVPNQQIKLDSDLELSLQDPIINIAESMADRGFSSLWSAAPEGTRAGLIFDDSAKIAYLRKLAVSGRTAYAAQCVGVSTYKIRQVAKKDNVFGQACEEAMEYFRDLLQAELYRRGVTGYKKEVLGGKDRDEIYEIHEYDNRMMMALLKIHMKEHQSTPKVSVNVEKGIAAPAGDVTVIHNNFDFTSLPAEDLDKLKALLQNQKQRDQDQSAIDGEFTDVES